MIAFRPVLFALTVLAMMLGFAPAASAQMEPGRLTGTVSDAQGAVLPGVTVTATSPSLHRLAIRRSPKPTDDIVSRRCHRAPTRSRIELTGFPTVKRENIQFAIGQTLTVDHATPARFAPGNRDWCQPNRRSSISSRRRSASSSRPKNSPRSHPPPICGPRSAQAPGIRMLGFDVGGSHKSQQTGYESFGVRGQNRVVTEGIDTTEGTNAAGIYQDFFAHEEVSVSASGADVSMSTPGSAVVSSIKSGGNEFKSLNNVTYEGSRFVDNNVDDDTRARGFTGQPNLKFWEAHFDLGGPIKRDKAWFYAAYNAFTIDKVISGVPRQFTDLAEFDELHGEGHVSRVAEGHAGRLLPVGREGQAAARPVVDGRSGQHPRAERADRRCGTRSISACGTTACSPTRKSAGGASRGRWCRRSTGGSRRRASTRERASRPARAGWRAIRAGRSRSSATSRSSR